VSGSTITVRTKPAGLTQVLKNADTQMNLNPIEMQAMSSCNTGDLIIGHCTASLSTSYAFQGWRKDYSGHQFWSKTINYNGGSVNADLTCSSCYASFVPSLHLNLNINNNALTLLELQILGTATVQVQITAAIRASYSASGTVPIDTLNLPSVTFFIGAFPVHLDFSVPIELDWSFTANGLAEVSTGVTVTDTIMGGLRYDGSNVNPERNNNFQTSFQSPAAKVTSSAVFKVYLVPKLDITFEAVATLGIAIKPYVEVDAGSSNNHLSGTVYAGLAVDISGNIGATLDGHAIGPQKPFGPVNVFDTKTPVFRG
jgi:hypothetical protein